MASILDFIGGPQGDSSEPLQELRTGTEPAMFLVFTTDSETVLLHFEGDDEVRSFVICPSRGCPLCFLGAAPQRFALLPVFNIESRRVEVLRISSQRGRQSLAAGLFPILRDPNVGKHVVIVRRDGSRYTVQSRSQSSELDRAEGVVHEFVRLHEEGLSLASIFPSYSAAELAEIPRVRRKLDAIGGYSSTSGFQSTATEHEGDGDATAQH